MKSKIILSLSVAAGLTAIPMLRAEPPVVVTPGTTTTTTVRTGVWTTVPDDYDGAYYLYNKQYYYGGKHEVGDFDWEGHHYSDRYFHDGKWIYGGKWEHHGRKERE